MRIKTKINRLLERIPVFYRWMAAEKLPDIEEAKKSPLRGVPFPIYNSEFTSCHTYRKPISRIFE